MRHTYLVGLMMLSHEIFAGVMPFTICLHNMTKASHHIQVADIENYDWEGDNRPDHNFNDLTIEPDSAICRQEDANNNADPRFTFVVDNNPTRMAVYNTGHPASPIFSWGAYTNPANPSTVYGRYASWRLANGWLMGVRCGDGPNCFSFELRKDPL